jgi:hypothetical protein
MIIMLITFYKNGGRRWIEHTAKDDIGVEPFQPMPEFIKPMTVYETIGVRESEISPLGCLYAAIPGEIGILT